MNSIQELLAQEEQWELKEGSIDDEDWYQEGIYLYKELLRLQPKEKRYKHNLAKLYLKQGRNEKLKIENYENYEKARELLEEALHYDNDNPDTHYHLGYIALFQRRWKDAIQHFEKRLAMQKKNHHQEIMSLFNLAISYHEIGDKKTATERYRQAKALDPEKKYSTQSEYVMMFQELAGDETKRIEDYEKSFELTTSDRRTRYISFKEVNKIISRHDGKTAILYIANYGSKFIGPLDSVELSHIDLKLLYLLLRSRRPLNVSEIRLEVWNTDERPEQVRVYIKRLRERLKVCFEEPMTEIIKAEPDHRYVWNSIRPFIIIRDNFMIDREI